MSIQKITLCFLLVFSTITNAKDIHHLYVFGDSLSDNGNRYAKAEGSFPPNPLYYHGRYSNGLMWPELLTNDKFHLTANALSDYAFGGAKVNDVETTGFLQQLDNYLSQNRVDDQGLYIIWIGSNDYYSTYNSSDSFIDAVTDDILNGVKKLVDMGAKNVVVINLPDLSKVPGIYSADKASGNHQASSLLHTITTTHNHMLNDKLEQERKTLSQGTHLLEIDMYSLMNKLLEHPEDYCSVNDKLQKHCLTNVLDSCLQVTDNENKVTRCDEPDNYAFWDSAHPTRIIHQWIAENIHQQWLEQVDSA